MSRSMNNNNRNSLEKAKNTKEYIFKRDMEENYISSVNKYIEEEKNINNSEKRKNGISDSKRTLKENIKYSDKEMVHEMFKKKAPNVNYRSVSKPSIEESEENKIQKFYDEKIMYDDFYDNLFNKKEYYDKSINKTINTTKRVSNSTINNIKNGDTGVSKSFNKMSEYDPFYNEDYEEDYEELLEKAKEIPEHLKAIKKIDEIILEHANKLHPGFTKKYSNEEKIKNVLTGDEYVKSRAKPKENLSNLDDKNESEITKPEPFEKKKFLEASLFMRIGHVLGLSLRNKYYKNLDEEVRKALNNNELYRVLEAQKNGYYLGKNLNKLTLEKLYKELTTHPLKLLEELVKRDVMLSFDHLSLVLLSNKGEDLINGSKLESYPQTKALYQDLLKKENFVYANKNLWLKTISDKDVFLQENNPLFYHEKMLSVCEKSELLGVKAALEKFLQEEDVLKSISKNKLIDKMLLKINLQLGNSMDLEHIVLDLPEVAQSIYKSIKEIKFSEDDIKILESNHNYEYELVDKRMPEAIMKYISVDSQYRNTLKNAVGKTAENLLIETLENILITKKDLNLIVNQSKLSDLSVTRRYTDSIRGEIGRPSLVTLKTLQQLKDSGELNDLANETILETINRKSPQVNYENTENNETISETTELAIKVTDVRMSLENKSMKKKLKI